MASVISSRPYPWPRQLGTTYSSAMYASCAGLHTDV
jgi:hypothetical protein